MMADFSDLSDAELQRLYWTMPITDGESAALNDRIADELSKREIGIAQALSDVGGTDG